MMLGESCNALRVFEVALAYSLEAGFEKELAWQRSTCLASFTESDLLREGAWVILCSGFREVSVRRVFDHVSLSFCDWESAESIVQQRLHCQAAAMASFRNVRKLNAVCKMAELIHLTGFALFKAEVLQKPIATLLNLPYIGPVTSMHLAKNLGLDVAKPDRHLVRLSQWLGYTSAFELCNDIARQTGEEVRAVDLILWRFMADVRPSDCRDLPI